MAFSALLSMFGPELLAALGPAEAGAAGASALPAAAGSVTGNLGSVASALPSSIDQTSPLLSTAVPFADAPAEASDILLGASKADPTLEARTAETGSALGDLFGGAEKASQASKLLGGGAPVPGKAPEPFSGGPTAFPEATGFNAGIPGSPSDIPFALGEDLNSQLEGIFAKSLSLLGPQQLRR